MSEPLIESTSFKLGCHLNMTKVECELISDAKMHLLFGKRKRGIVS